MAVNFFNIELLPNLPKRKKLKAFICELFKTKGYVVGNITYVFCSDKYLIKLNQEFLNHNTLTDIITFTLSEPGKPVEAEIYISNERVKYNAKQYAVSYNNELHRVIFHGAFHLCGYDDKTKKDKTLMRLLENRSLSKYFCKNVSRGT